MIFREYLKEKIQPNESLIEFGPLTRPLFSKQEKHNIYYADVRSTKEIKELYTSNDYLSKTGISVDIKSIVDIDYIITKTYKETFKGQKFDGAYLSHVIEHMPNIIEFFIEISDILKDNGKLYIIYPDKRYCFDHFRNEVSFRDAYATYKYGTKENARLAFDFYYNVVDENNPTFFWNNNNLTSIISNSSIKEAEKYYQKELNYDNIDDVHLWPFSDIGFLKFIYEMQRAELLSFDIEEFYPTMRNTQEFMIILKKNNNINIEKTIKIINDNTTLINNLCTNLGKSQNSISKDEIINKNYQNEIKKQQEYINKLEENSKDYQNEIKKQQEYINKLEKNSKDYQNEIKKHQ